MALTPCGKIIYYYAKLPRPAIRMASADFLQEETIQKCLKRDNNPGGICHQHLCTLHLLEEGGDAIHDSSSGRSRAPSATCFSKSFAKNIQENSRRVLIDSAKCIEAQMKFSAGNVNKY